MESVIAPTLDFLLNRSSFHTITRTAVQVVMKYQPVKLFSIKHRARVVKSLVLNVPHSIISQMETIVQTNLKALPASLTSICKKWAQVMHPSSDWKVKREGWQMTTLIQIIRLAQPSKKTSRISRTKVITVNSEKKKSKKTRDLLAFKMLIKKLNQLLRFK